MTPADPIPLFKSLVSYEVIRAEALPDPQVPGVYLIFAETDQGDRAAILYEDLPDFEEVDFEEAAAKYGKGIKLLSGRP